MAIKYGEPIKQFKYKIKVFANVRYEKYPEDEPTELLNHHILIQIIDNLTRIQLKDLDISLISITKYRNERWKDLDGVYKVLII